MVNLHLFKHNIEFKFNDWQTMSDSIMGKWLEDNNIEYKINNFTYETTYSHKGNMYYMVYIRNMWFSNEEGAMAFKLRWAK